MSLASPVLSTERRTWGVRVAAASFILAVPGAFSPNPLLTISGLSLIPAMFFLLWRPGEPPVLLFAAFFQWLQVYMPIVLANRAGLEISNHSFSSSWSFAALPEMHTAALLGIGSVAALSVGMRVGAGKGGLVRWETLDRAGRLVSNARLAQAYLITFVIGIVANRMAAALPSLRQPFGALEMLRWAVVFLIGWISLTRRGARSLAVAVLSFEFLLGFLGYFGSFKIILFLALIVLLGRHFKLRMIIKPSLIVFVAVSIAAMSFWQSVKGEYRQFLNQGEGTQAVLASVPERIDYLVGVALDVSFDDIATGFDLGLTRIGYLDFFALCIRNVPAVLAHTEGQLWGEAVLHVFTPRVLFPNKPSIDDSIRTATYTGVGVAGADRGTSVSIGYVGESYVDFGPVGMFVPVLLLGYFWGWSYVWLARRTRHALLGLAVSVNLILRNALYFESSNVKIVGGGITVLLVMWVILSLFDDRIWQFLTGGRGVRRPTSEFRNASTSG